MTGSSRGFPLPGFAGRQYGAGRGEGPRTLLLHGFTGDARDWSAWPADAPSALALDLPGHGSSQDPAGPFANEIERLLAALPPSIDQLVGYSLGGRIALSLIRARPERFRSATILSAHPGLTDPRQRDARRRSDQRWIRLLRADGIVPFVDAWERQPLFATQAKTPAHVLAHQRRRRLSQRAEGMARNLACFGLAEMPETWTALTRWKGSLLWLAGALDSKFAALAERVKHKRPDTTMHLIRDVGHDLLLEAPQTLHRCFAIRVIHP